MIEQIIETDVLVIGGGMSGIFASIKACTEGVKVTLVEKAYTGRSGAAMYAESFSVFNEAWGHKLDSWIKQISITGDYTNNPEWTEISLKESYDRYQDLLSWGMKFQKKENGEVFRDAGGSLERCVHERGWHHLPLLRKQALKVGVTIMDRIMVIDLIVQEGKVIGAVGFHTRSGDFFIFKAKATVICTGGGGLGVTDHIEMPFTYDGEAMAFRAGAAISGKEFPGMLTPIIGGDEHYTATGGNARISLKDRAIKLVPEGWRHPTYGPGKYIDAEGNTVNWLTIASSVTSGRGPIYYDLDSASPEEINAMLQKIKHQDIDFIGESLIDPTLRGLYLGATRFEFALGSANIGGGQGIWSADTGGGTSLPGLYAAGDCYHSGAVGAVYPYMGFGTRNAAVTGARAGRKAAEYAVKAKRTEIDQAEVGRLKSSVYAPLDRVGGFDAKWVTLQLKTIMTPYYVWIVRHGERLKAALTMVEYLNNNIGPQMYCRPRDAHGLRSVHEAKGRVQAAEMMLRSALFRTESRGSHYREDYPRRDDPAWLALVKIQKSKGKVSLIKEPFPQKTWPDLKIPYKERYPRRFLGEE